MCYVTGNFYMWIVKSLTESTPCSKRSKPLDVWY